MHGAFQMHKHAYQITEIEKGDCKMRITVFKLLCCLYVINKNDVVAYHSDIYSTKDSNVRLKERYSFRGVANRIDTSYRYPSYRNSHQYNNRDGYTTITPVHIRHSHHPHLDGIISKVLSTQKPTRNISSTMSDDRKSRDLPREKNLGDENEESENEDLEEDMHDYDDWEDDYEENEESSETDEDLGDDNDTFEDYEDDDEESEDDSWQAEEASQSLTSVPSSSITQYKWDTLGSRKKVEEMRRQHYPNYSSNNLREVNEAVKHAIKVNHDARCRTPYPKIISVQAIHPDPKKTYIPHCTILHRCEDDTGCCNNYRTRCTVKSQEKVDLYFYTTSVGGEGNKVEKLSFFNHTECACLEKPADSSNEEATLKSFQNYSPYTTYDAPVKSAQPSVPQNIRWCKCPKEYSPRYQYFSSKCYCDCLDGSLGCLKMKKGKEFFSLNDRICIRYKRCGIPSCEYGTYQENLGRCPKKHERIGSSSVND